MKNGGKKSSDSVEEKAHLSADVSLPADVLEKLYQSYAIKQKRDGLSSFLVASIMFDLWAIVVPLGQRLESLGEFLSVLGMDSLNSRGRHLRNFCNFANVAGVG